MLWKRPNLTQRIASVSVQQGPSRHPSLADWRCDCSPEGTSVIPRERYVSSLCPQISDNWKIGRFYSYRILFIHIGSKFICYHWLSQEFVRTRTCLFMSDPKYLYRILFLFLPGPILFIPDPKYSYQIRVYSVAADYSRDFEYYCELTIYLEIICTGSKNIEVELSNWLISQKWESYGFEYLQEDER